MFVSPDRFKIDQLVNYPGCLEQLFQTLRLDAVLAFIDKVHGMAIFQAETGLLWFTAQEWIHSKGGDQRHSLSLEPGKAQQREQAPNGPNCG